MTALVRLSINLAPDTATELKRLAALKDVSVTDAVRRAIAVWSFWEKESAAGAKPVLIGADGVPREVVIL